MNIKIEMMTQGQAEEIAYQWHYDGAYAFYNMEADPDDLEEFVNEHKRGNRMFVASNETEMIGFFGFQTIEADSIEMALGMKPALTGKGLGQEFLQAGITFALSSYKPEKLIVSVATFNRRAIKLYKKVGFIEHSMFMQETNGSQFEFLKLSYSPSN